jgi:hypothetical protein
MVAYSLAGVHNVLVKCSCEKKLNTQGLSSTPTGRNPEDSYEMSVGATQCVLLYLSIDYDRYYLGHFAQHG